MAGLSGEADLLTFDMGGTSTDVAPVRDGQVQTTTESVVAGVPVKLPMVDVHTVSAGGGSIAWIDSGGALRVGPHSAGAEPGPPRTAGAVTSPPSPTQTCTWVTWPMEWSWAARYGWTGRPRVRLCCGWVIESGSTRIARR